MGRCWPSKQTMSESFDPYLKWLGIPKKDQPPNHYRLLGIETFESDPEVVSNAADQRMAHLKNFATGKHSALSQKILNEIAAARVCLLNEAGKQQYDAQLQERMQPSQGAPPVRAAAAVPVSTPTVVSPAQDQVAPVVSVTTETRASRTTRKSDSLANNPIVWAVSAGVAGLVAVVLFVLLAGGPGEDVDPLARTGGLEPSNTEPSNTEPSNTEPANTEPSTTDPSNVTDFRYPSDPIEDGLSGQSISSSGESLELTDERSTEDGEEPNTSTPEQPVVESPVEPPKEPIEPPKEPTVESPAEPSKEPVAEPREPSPTEGATKVARPTDEQRGEALKAIRDIYKDDIKAADSPRAMRSLADSFYSEANDSGGDRLSQYVLFEMAAKTAAEGGDLDRAFRAVDRIGSIFKVNGLSMKADLLEDLGKAASHRGGTPEQNSQVVQAARSLCEEALEKTELQVAEKLMRIALPAARRLKDRQLVAEIDESSRTVSRMRTQYRMVEKALEVLETKPDSPEASLTVGNWRCFVEGDWEKGLPLLAQCDSDEVSKAATLDMKNPSTPADVVAVGDAWWDLSDDRSGMEKHRARQRAAHWYNRAIGQLSGLTKTKVEKRLREIGAGLGKYALRFDGRRSHVVVNNFVYPGTTPITIEAIVKVDPSKAYGTSAGRSSGYAYREQTVISNSQGSTSNGLYLQSYYGKWRACLYYSYKYSPSSTYIRTSSASISSSSSIVTNRWTHLALVYDGSSLRLYVDGKLSANSSTRGVHKPGTMPFVIGATPDGMLSSGIDVEDFFAGDIKGVRISNTARYMQDFRPPETLRADSSAKLLFDFREGRGTTLNTPGKSNTSGAIKNAEWVKQDGGSTTGTSSGMRGSTSSTGRTSTSRPSTGSSNNGGLGQGGGMWDTTGGTPAVRVPGGQ